MIRIDKIPRIIILNTVILQSDQRLSCISRFKETNRGWEKGFAGIRLSGKGHDLYEENMDSMSSTTESKQMAL